MSNIKQSLEDAMSLDGAIGVALVDFKTGMTLGTAGGGGTVNLEVAAAGNTEVVRAKLRVMEKLGIRESIEDILITLGTQFHIIRVCHSRPGVFFYLMLSKEKANLAYSRMKLADIDGKLQI